jgi:hypothetical protein
MDGDLRRQRTSFANGITVEVDFDQDSLKIESRELHPTMAAF